MASMSCIYGVSNMKYCMVKDGLWNYCILCDFVLIVFNAEKKQGVSLVKHTGPNVQVLLQINFSAYLVLLLPPVSSCAQSQTWVQIIVCMLNSPECGLYQAQAW